MSKIIGPKLSDEEFFGSLINTNIAGLEKIPAYVEKNNYCETRKILADYVRKNLNPEMFFKAKQPFLTDICKYPGETDRQAADRICRLEIISCGIPHQFEGEVDWQANPTANQYFQWPVQLSRHYEFYFLAKAYNETGNSKYAECLVNLFKSWVRQEVIPEEPYDENATWLTLNAGIRMAVNWQYALHSFYRCEVFTDDLLTDWYKSVWEHGDWLRKHHRHGNWLIMEMNGLAHIGLLYPLFKESKNWLDYAIDKLKKETQIQIYPDGFQYELATDYQETVLYNYFHLESLLSTYNFKTGFVSALANAVELYIKIMMPDGRLPNINDGTWCKAAEYIKPKTDFFPLRKDFLWAASDGVQGEKPDYKSVILPYSGFMVMRNGWEKNSVWALLDAAPYGRGHQHEDKLSLLIYANGKLIMTEGGIYAYDTSEMRKYVLSTRSHNTIRVNGQDQNRGRHYHWNENDIKKDSGINAVITDTYDMAESIYDEGYGPEAKNIAVHKRKVIFIKKPEKDINPFFIVIDRLYSNENNEYELLWHLDEENVTQNGTEITTDNIKIFTSNKDLHTSLIKGQEEPELQGYKANTFLTGDYSPIYALQYLAKGSNLKVVTLFYPLYDKDCLITGIDTQVDVDDDNVVIIFRDGSNLKYNI